MKPETIYILRQPDGSLYIEDKFTVHTDKGKAEDALAMMYTCREPENVKGEWTVQEFVAVPAKQSSSLLSQADGGLRERTLRQFARDMKAAMELTIG